VVAEMTWAKPMRHLHVRGERETSSMHRRDQMTLFYFIFYQRLNDEPTVEAGNEKK
jgi:hypothetical protein